VLYKRPTLTKGRAFVFRLENIRDLAIESRGDLEGQRQAGIDPAGLERVDRLP
jgi:hypothetical protein